MEWVDLGNLSDMRYFTLGGVYLLVHRGKYDRVVYVGTSSNIVDRCWQHYKKFLDGQRTVWRVTSSDDVYTFMSTWGVRNHIVYFRKLAHENKVWASTTLDKFAPENLLLRQSTFDQDWQDWLHQHYLPSIHVWALGFRNYNARACVLIESTLQQRLVETFRLGRFFNHQDYSILGKIELNESFHRLKTSFDNTPGLDEASTIIFDSVTEKQIPAEAINLAGNQLKCVIHERKLVQAKRRKLREARHLRNVNQGKPWTRVDMEKLRIMLMEFNMVANEMTPYLGRTTNAIDIQIERNDKLSNRLWRNSIDFLDLRR